MSLDPTTPLIDSEGLAARLAEEGSSSRLRLIDARSGALGRSAYAERHLLGAVHADLDRDLAAPAPHPERGGRHPLPVIADFTAYLGSIGVAPDTDVVVYDDQGGANAAARLWWMLRSLGHRSVAVLDGGIQGAVASGIPTESGEGRARACPAYPATRFGWPTVTIEEVDARREDQAHLLIDVRAASRYRGDQEPIDPVAGRIPGAINVPLSENLDATGRFKSPEALRALYALVLGAVPPARVMVHCGSGVTACHTLLALERAGLEGAALYVGSFGEWCRGGRPIARG